MNVKKLPRLWMFRRSAVMHRLLWSVLILVLIGGYWLLPIQGQIIVLTDPRLSKLMPWPQIWIEPSSARPGDHMLVYVRDNVPWVYLKVLVDGVEAQYDTTYTPGNGPWTWRWRFDATDHVASTVVFYRDCHTGCIERTRVTLGSLGEGTATSSTGLPTKLGVVFADYTRDWHGRTGWDVEIVYLQRPNDSNFGIDGLAQRVWQARQLGLRVLVRVAYDQQQALPPTGDEVALARYLEDCAKLVRDERLNDVYAYIIGSGFNTKSENFLNPDRSVTPEWYARVFNGYDVAPAHTDNVVQTMRAVDPHVRVLVGPVAPWSSDQDGARLDPYNVPWLNYMNTLVAAIDTAALAKQQLGIPMIAPDGFAVQARGRPDAPEVVANPAQEPATDLHRVEWGDAQAGFRIYRDWLTIINRYPTTRGLPVYINATNTWVADTNTLPAQNYPPGWLTTAFAEVQREPQIQALCWFVDSPLGELWDEFSLSKHPGHLYDASDEFDQLLHP